tara:strand:- start:844 stop:1068 length:225 start_codon:yes stop_codon:yes gene_type:complete
MKNLYELEPDLIGTIARLDSSYDSKLRLAEMGVMPGIDIRMIKKSPFGGPVQVKINNYYLTLRKEDALLIYLNN